MIAEEQEPVGKNMEKLVFEGVRDFDPDQIFDCGQCFRWEKQPDGSYIGPALGVVARVSYESGGRLVIEKLAGSRPLLEEEWRHYFDLDRDYGEIKKLLSSKDDILAEAIKYGQGIRILNQDKWETLISFIISQNNNIPRIKKCIEKLCERFGECIGEISCEKSGSSSQESVARDPVCRWMMPRPQVLAALSPEDLEDVRLGYRARYIIETARAVSADGGETLKRTEAMTSSEAYQYLTGLCGVGPKVANCIMLFSMGKCDSFPIDVWVRRVMSELYGFSESDVRGMRSFAAEHFGEYGGIAQQYLFYYIRERK